ncbi:MAG: MarR family transcriptional regulator [Bacilli bacterium]|nr:MarR family transcriptional regulator [Bacilli bacterium]
MDTRLTELFKLIAGESKRRMDKILLEFDLSFSQVIALNYICEKSGEITQRELEGMLNISHPATHGIIKRLEAKGFISTYPDKKDKRNIVVFATKQGQSTIASLKEMELSETKAIGLTDEEKDELLHILTKVYDGIKKLEAI